MPDTKHTPGPWDSEHHEVDPKPSADDPGYYTIEAQVSPGEGVGPVADTLNRDYRISPEEDEANARLIAASPDLLAACEAARDAIGVALAKVHDERHVAITALENAREMLRDTVAKAEGADK